MSAYTRYATAYDAGFAAYQTHSYKSLWSPAPANPHVDHLGIADVDAAAGWQAGWDAACANHEAEMNEPGENPPSGRIWE